jgi:hypothetical protein
MTRPRLASAVLAAGLGLVCGCSSDFSLRNMFSHHRGAAEAGCCTEGGCPCEGGVSGFEGGGFEHGGFGGGPVLTPHDGPVVPPPPGPPLTPPLTPPPQHVVPIPATPMPYAPG